jgi:hypothetical protein
MSKTWKWIVGILAVVVVVGLVAGAVFMYTYHGTWWGACRIAGSAPDDWKAPGGAYGFGRDPHHHMYGWDSHMPMMYGGRMGLHPFGFGFLWVGILFRMLLPLGLLALVAYLFYQMGKRAGSAGAAPSSPRPLPARKVARR